MNKIEFEELVINSLIILKEKYNISKVTSPQLEKYKETIFKLLKNLTVIILMILSNYMYYSLVIFFN